MTSFNPPNPIINVRHANYLFKIYSQMINQIKPFDNNYFEDKSVDLKAVQKHLNQWKKKNSFQRKIKHITQIPASFSEISLKIHFIITVFCIFK